jgi:hypothetical protein
VFHAWRASPSNAEEADKGADRDNNALSTIDPVGACPIEDEGAQSLGGIGTWVIAESPEEPHQDSLIDVKRRLSQSTVFVHPRSEFSERRPEVSGGWWSRRERKLIVMLEKPDEQRGGGHRMVIGAAMVRNALLLLDCKLACLESRNEVLRGEPCGEHPIRPAGEGGQQAVDRD